MKKSVRVTCYGCEQEGPEAKTAAEARHAAERDGWYIGQRGQYSREGDYCGDCRSRVDTEVCSADHSSGEGICGSLAMYEIRHHDQAYMACGKHYSGTLRDLFYAHPKDELTIRRLRASLNHKAS